MSKPLLPDNLVRKLQESNDRITRLELGNDQLVKGPIASRPLAHQVKNGFKYFAEDLNNGSLFQTLNNEWILLAQISPASVVGATRRKYDQYQNMPGNPWVISYEGSVPPSVTVVVGGAEVEADLVFNETDKKITVNFWAPTQGVAYLS